MKYIIEKKYKTIVMIYNAVEIIDKPTVVQIIARREKIIRIT